MTTTQTTDDRLAAIEAAVDATLPRRGGPDPAIRIAAFGVDDITWLLAELKAARAALHRLLVLDDWETAAEYLNRGAE